MREAEAFLTRRGALAKVGGAALLSAGFVASCSRQDGYSAEASAAEAATTPTPLTLERLEMLRARGALPALAAAAQAHGRSLNLASGSRLRGGDKPATTRDQWHLGSIA